MKKLLLAIASILLLVSCGSNSAEKKTEQPQTDDRPEVETTGVTWNGYTQIDPRSIKDNVIRLISEDWMLITAGKANAYNTMTASWGMMGEVWGKHVAAITVRDSRYTYQFLEKNDTYTLSFFTRDYRPALELLGTKSGRDGNKVAESGLTPIELESGDISFVEARMVIECRKLYAEPFKKDSFTDKSVYESAYNDEHSTSMHTLYIGEIVNVWIK